MKSSHLFLTIFGCALLIHTASFADQASQPVAQSHDGRGRQPDNSDGAEKVIPPDRGAPHPREKLPEKGKPSGRKGDNSGASNKSDAGSHAKNTREIPKGYADESRREKTPITQKRPGEDQAITSRPKTASQNGENPLQRESNKPVGVAKQGLLKNQPDNHQRFSNPRTAASVGGLPLAARGRESSQAIIGGTMRLTSGNTAAINGNGIKRSLTY